LRASTRPTYLSFDIVVVNLKPFERIAARRDSRENDVIDAIDVEGPAILRAAAKNFERVVVVADPDVYPLVIEELKQTGLDPSFDTRKLLASRAFDCTAHYELSVANWFSEVEEFPTLLLRDYVKLVRPAVWREPAPAVGVLRRGWCASAFAEHGRAAPGH